MAKQSYKQLSEELQKVMANLEGGDLDIDEAVTCYERGLKIVKELEQYLTTAENKVRELKASAIEDIEDIEEE